MATGNEVTARGTAIRPLPAYLPVDSKTSPLIPDPSLYKTIHVAPKRLIASHTVPIRRAVAWTVRAGQTFRLTTPHGPQVGDLNIWSKDNPRERFWASRTRQLHATHVTTGHRLWSCLPYLRPLVTITGDSLGGSQYGTDQFGGRCHDLLGTRCDPYVGALLNGGQGFDFACHSNLTRAVLPWGLNEQDVHDVLNVFQVTGLDEQGRYWMGTSPAKKTDYIEFFAEVDVLCALSACPGGDLSKFGWNGNGGGGGDPMLETCRPLGVEVYEFEDRDQVLQDWTPPKSPPYKGLHGIRMPTAD